MFCRVRGADGRPLRRLRASHPRVPPGCPWLAHSRRSHAFIPGRRSSLRLTPDRHLPDQGTSSILPGSSPMSIRWAMVLRLGSTSHSRRRLYLQIRPYVWAHVLYLLRRVGGAEFAVSGWLRRPDLNQAKAMPSTLTA